MRYYVTSDVHGFFSEMKTALEENGYFEDTEPHKLIICGDLFDRGSEAVALQEFILDLLTKDEVILIQGNHEDLALDLLNEWHLKSYKQHHHHVNMTINTVYQLTDTNMEDLYFNPEEMGRRFLKSPYIQTIIPAMLDYYETDHYIFTHGWIPCIKNNIRGVNEKKFTAIDDWRNADEEMWDRARWINGMEAHHDGVKEAGKTIVCGHWHCSFGHSIYEKKGGEFDKNPDFTPYYAEGIIAIDGCTSYSGKVNCIVIED